MSQATVTVVDAEYLHHQLNRIEDAISKLPVAAPQPPAQQPVGYMSRKDVCAHFGISTTTLHTWIKRNILTAYKIGNRTVFKRAEVEASPVAINRGPNG
jgi:excisionase family DNA binding protein